jgi:hypothetical protein
MDTAPQQADPKVLLRREYARKWYAEHKGEKKIPVPKSYDVEYRKNYHKDYYQKNRDRLLQHQKELNKQRLEADQNVQVRG